MHETVGAEGFGRLFTTFQRSAWRWECQGIYREAAEGEPLRKYLAGEKPDDTWRTEFLAMVREATNSGKQFGRVRRLTVPLTDYLRFEMDLAERGNIPAGEDIRVLWPEQADDLRLPDQDFWLFDDTVAARMHFANHGFTEAEIITGSDVEQYREWKRIAGQHALPFEAYTTAVR